MNATDRSSCAYPTVTAIKDIQAAANLAIDLLKKVCRLDKGFCTVLAVLTIYSGIASISLAKNVSSTGQSPPSVVYRYYLDTKSSYFTGGIKDPYHPQEYIKQLAAKLGEKGAKNLLLQGLDISQPKGGGPKQAYITATTIEPEHGDFTEELREALSYPGPVHSSDRTAQFRANDGKDPLWQAGKTAEQAGKTIVEISDGVYSIADLISFDSLPDLQRQVYQDSAPIARPLVFTARSIEGGWKTVEHTCNIPTLGYFDNLTGIVSIYIEDFVKTLETE